MAEKIDWTKEASEALTYFSRLGISSESIEAMIDDVYERVSSGYVGRLNDAVDTLFGNRLVERLGNNIEDERAVARHGVSLSAACSFYCFDRIIEGKKYRNFYDFLGQCKRELQN